MKGSFLVLLHLLQIGMFIGAALHAQPDFAVQRLLGAHVGIVLHHNELGNGVIRIGKRHLAARSGEMLMPEQTMSILPASRAGMMPSQSMGWCLTSKPILRRSSHCLDVEAGGIAVLLRQGEGRVVAINAVA